MEFPDKIEIAPWISGRSRTVLKKDLKAEQRRMVTTKTVVKDLSDRVKIKQERYDNDMSRMLAENAAISADLYEERRRNNAQANYAKQNDETLKLKRKLSNQQTEMEQVKKKMKKECDEELNKKQKKYEDLKKTLDADNLEKLKKDHTISELMKKNETLAQELACFKKKLENQSKELEIKETTRDECFRSLGIRHKSEVTRLEENLKVELEMRERQEKELEVKEDSIKKLEGRVVSLENELNKKTGDITSLSENVDSARKELEVKEDSTKRLEERVLSLTKKVTESNKSQERMKEDFKAQLNQKTSEIKMLKENEILVVKKLASKLLVQNTTISKQYELSAFKDEQMKDMSEKLKKLQTKLVEQAGTIQKYKKIAKLIGSPNPQPSELEGGKTVKQEEGLEEEEIEVIFIDDSVKEEKPVVATNDVGRDVSVAISKEISPPYQEITADLTSFEFTQTVPKQQHGASAAAAKKPEQEEDGEPDEVQRVGSLKIRKQGSIHVPQGFTPELKELLQIIKDN